jgi:hypothetical protein
MSRPGYAGLSVERFGDAEPFRPTDIKITPEEEESSHLRARNDFE